MTLSNARNLFDLPDGLIYLNAAYMGPLPRAASDAAIEAYRSKMQPWTMRRDEAFFGVPDAVRQEAASLMKATADDIALVPAVSYGLATAARNLPLDAGQTILTLDEQFPSNVYTWRRMAARAGAEVKTVARSANQSWTEALLAAIGPETGLIACPQVHWIDGGWIDLAAVGGAARAQGARLVLDLTQSLGITPFDVSAVQPDFAVAAGYKWLLGPYACAYLYVAPEHQSSEPLEENWIARAGSENFAGLVEYEDAYRPGAERFDMGERSNFQILPAALVGLRLINRFGVDALNAHAAAISQAIIDRTAPLGMTADTPDRAAHYLGLTLPGGAPADLAARLAAAGVHVSRRGDKLRVTPHLYNTVEDADRFADTISAALARP